MIVNVPSSKLPGNVLQTVKMNFMDHEGCGLPILEVSLASEKYLMLKNKSIDLIRSLLNVPINYEILYIPCDRQGLYAAVCMNLIGKIGGVAEYLVTGMSSLEAAEEALKYGDIRIRNIESSEDKEEFVNQTFKFDDSTSYVYYCDNEVLNGIEFHYVPDTKRIPLVVDMSSNIFKKCIDVSQFDVILANTHHIFGMSGLSIVIIKRNLIGDALEITPAIMEFQNIYAANSMYSTLPNFILHVLCTYCEWIIERGGIGKIAEYFKNSSKSIYDVILKSNGYYYNSIDENYRSTINICLLIKNNSINHQTPTNTSPEDRYNTLIKKISYRYCCEIESNSSSDINPKLIFALNITDNQHEIECLVRQLVNIQNID